MTKEQHAAMLIDINETHNEQPLPVPEGSMFAHLHECAKLSIFTEDFLISEAKNMSDRNYEMYVEKKRSRAEGLAEGEKRAEDRAAKRMDFLRSMGVPEEIIVGAAAIK